MFQNPLILGAVLESEKNVVFLYRSFIYRQSEDHLDLADDGHLSYVIPSEPRLSRPAEVERYAISTLCKQVILLFYTSTQALLEGYDRSKHDGRSTRG